MPNVSTLSNNSKLNLTQSKPTLLLDTLAQLVTKAPKPPLTKGSEVQKSSAKLTLQKRAKSKAFTQFKEVLLANLPLCKGRITRRG